jgi:protein-tyrosine-phosphatase
MAEGMLREKLRERGVDATVSSAGLSFDGREATAEAIEVADAYGVDIRPHRSRVLRKDLLAADLVITMERMHLREAVVVDTAVLGRCFTLKELVRRGEEVGVRQRDESLADWLARVGEDRRLVELLGDSDEDDVADPYMQTIGEYKQTARELDDLVTRLVDLAFPYAPGKEGVA